ncbi:alpha/beta-hydrolase [Punctularia strigosozonata HHB-11173 SS5]|uniref:Alpha/beta-hydrolase n=1 Tax=Punctularia strigosozonata (strain HHB-11173) TaxID=741275 RepID=R7S0Y4_PUNST|nr:alpha/beta-hydrolase [Punctularia strigosozonata HHB-11173 SS5]EIN03457.1 alpha/beta-hydrolase [Punctularia strigosozonata HHB-11173 SS5]
MDPSDPLSFVHKSTLLSTGRQYHYVDQLPPNYGWRYQIRPWVERGYRVIVPDMLGYGTTDKPYDVGAYTTKRLCEDLVALLDHIGVRKAVMIGHDWGSFTVSRFALWHPDRIIALIQLSVPYTPPAPEYISVEEMARRYSNFAYQVYFADPSSTQEIEDNLFAFWSRVYRKPGSGHGILSPGSRKLAMALDDVLEPDGLLLTPQETQYYRPFFEGAMRGPLNYYRTARLRFEEEKAANLPTTLPASLPALLIWGTEDPTCLRPVVARAHKFVPSLREVSVEGCGHWIMIEAKDAVTQTVLDFLDSVNLLGERPVAAKL